MLVEKVLAIATNTPIQRKGFKKVCYTKSTVFFISSVGAFVTLLFTLL